MSRSSPPVRHRIRRSSRPPRAGRSAPPQRSRMPGIRFALVVTAASGLIATSAYFLFSDDDHVFTRLIGQPQIQITSEDQIAHLRTQFDRVSFDQEQVEQQVKVLQQRQATLEQTLANMPAWPESGVIDTVPQMSPIETPSAPAIVAVAHEEHAKKVEQAIIRGKEPRHRKHARVARKQTHEVPIITVGHTADAEPFGQLNSY